MKTALITGITGQDGSYLAEFLLEKGYEVHVGLMTTHFNALSGTLRRNNNFIFGSSDGAIEFNIHTESSPAVRWSRT